MKKKKERELLYPLEQSNLRASNYVDYFENNFMNSIFERDCYEKEKKLTNEDKKFYCSDEDKITIKNLIYDFYAGKKIIFTELDSNY